MRKAFPYNLLLLLFLVAAGALLSAQDSKPPERVVAVVNGRKITLAEVDSKAGMGLYRYQQRVFVARRTALHQVITDVLLQQEAEAQGSSLAEYKKRLLLETEVSEADVDDIIRKMYPPEAMENRVLREQVRNRLEVSKRAEVLQAKGEELRKTAQVELHLLPPVPPKMQVDLSGREGLGNPSAPVTLVEFGDFACRHCRAAVPVVKEILARYGNKVRYFYRHLPVTQPQSWTAADASECARMEGKFWEYHDLLFEKTDSLSLKTILELAGSLNMDTRSFEDCLLTQKTRPIVQEDFREARRLGAQETPTFFINGRRFSGTPTVKELQQLIEEELVRVSDKERQE